LQLELYETAHFFVGPLTVFSRFERLERCTGAKKILSEAQIRKPDRASDHFLPSGRHERSMAASKFQIGSAV